MDSPENGFWLRLICLLLVIAAGLHSADKSIGGGDTWVAMACGRYTLGPWAQDQAHRTWQMKVLDGFGIHCTQQDPFGAKSRPYRPESRQLSAIGKRVIASLTGGELDTTLEDVGWVNQNWLTHVLFYRLKTVFGENSIVLYKFIQAVLTALFAYWAARALGVYPALAAFAVLFGVLLSRSFVDLRPNVSSILFAAITIGVLARWRNGNNRALLWFIPVMIVWSNIHGGFIYAILIFTIALIGYAIQSYLRGATLFFLVGGFLGGAILILNGLRHAGDTLGGAWKAWAIITALLAFLMVGLLIWRSGALASVSYQLIPHANLVWLAGGLAGVVAIPALFSPFGLENLIHPLVIAMGEEGKIWRNVIEWKPIWDPAGFGNVTPYLCFLVLLELVFVAWWILWCTRPAPVLVGRNKNAPAVPETTEWPRADLSMVVIMVLTVTMSLASRRFVFLAGVALCPYLAKLVQEVLWMASVRFAACNKCPLGTRQTGRPERVMTAISALAAVAMLGIFLASMKAIYFSPPVDGKEMTVFRRMVGINDQPVRAMAFVDANRLSGVMFNEWTNGGYVAFGQTPQPDNGSPLCQVYMDGRAQAAYRVSHFARWQALNPGVNKEQAQAHYGRLETWVKQKGQTLDSPDLFDFLLREGQRDPQAQQMLALALTREEFYNAVFKKEKITAALLTLKRASSVYIMETLLRSNNWRIVYLDDKELVLLRLDAPENQELLARDVDTLNFPDAFTKTFTVGYTWCNSGDPEKVRQGLDLLMGIDRDDYVPLLANTAYQAASRLRQTELAQTWFQGCYDYFKAKVESPGRLGRFESLRQLSSCCEILGRLANDRGDRPAAEQYKKQADTYIDQARMVISQFSGGLFW